MHLGCHTDAGDVYNFPYKISACTFSCSGNVILESLHITRFMYTLHDLGCFQVLDILARLSIAERASIDECYLDISEEAKKRLAASSAHPPLPINVDQVHVCGEASTPPFFYAKRPHLTGEVCCGRTCC